MIYKRGENICGGLTDVGSGVTTDRQLKVEGWMTWYFAPLSMSLSWNCSLRIVSYLTLNCNSYNGHGTKNIGGNLHGWWCILGSDISFNGITFGARCLHIQTLISYNFIFLPFMVQLCSSYFFTLRFAWKQNEWKCDKEQESDGKQNKQIIKNFRIEISSLEPFWSTLPLPFLSIFPSYIMQWKWCMIFYLIPLQF